MSGKSIVMLPESDVHFQATAGYIERVPDADYSQAPEQAREAFRDMKYGLRVHWGLYTQWHLKNESWPFLKMSDEERFRYQELYKEFNPKGFDAEEWMGFFERAGFKCFAFTSKHHEGFSMFDTKTRVKQRVNWLAESGPRIENCDLSYSIMDSPYKRDIVKELCDAAHRHGIKIDLYFSHPDWFDADFRPYGFHPLTVPDQEKLLTEREMSEIPSRFGDNQRPVAAHALTEEEKARMIARHREQLMELLTNYGKIDMICLDMWLGADVWPDIRETIKMLRKIQPDVMFRGRGVGSYADYYTPEGFVPGGKENTDMPWMVIYPLAGSFSYDPNGGNYKGAGWIILNLIDSTAKGGNFMVAVGPDENGLWHPEAIRQLEEAGKWLRVNGEAIYGTRERPGELYKEGDSLYFTRSKDSRTVYAICAGWPGKSLTVRSVCPREGSDVRLLGYGCLPWTFDNERGLTIELPEGLQKEENRPCGTAYAFRIEV